VSYLDVWFGRVHPEKDEEQKRKSQLYPTMVTQAPLSSVAQIIGLVIGKTMYQLHVCISVLDWHHD